MVNRIAELSIDEATCEVTFLFYFDIISKVAGSLRYHISITMLAWRAIMMALLANISTVDTMTTLKISLLDQ